MANARYSIIWLALLSCLAGLVAIWLDSDAHRNHYLPRSLDLLTLGSQELSKLLQNGSINSVQLVQEYLRRIDLDNEQGLRLRAVLTLVPRESIIATANLRDIERFQNATRSELHGIPVLLKDNMATEAGLGMKTTFGASAFRNASANEDAFIVKKIREAGMIVLGKANLDELNGFKGDRLPTGWSTVGGQTVSPYDGEYPCGSSGGSAVAVAAGFAPLALGTETQGSMSCPASHAALYAIKPSTGLLSRSGILPSSTTFDAPGILGKSTWDISNALDLASGPDDTDPATLMASLHHYGNFAQQPPSNWSDWRIGLADPDWFWSSGGVYSDGKEEDKMLSLAREAVARMESLGAYVQYDAPMLSAHLSREEAPEIMAKLIRHEMQPGFSRILSKLSGSQVKNLSDLVRFNQKHPYQPSTGDFNNQNYLERALYQNISESQYTEILHRAHEIGIEQGINYVLDKYDLDVLVAPAWTWLSIFTAFSKSPVGTVPLGTYPNGRPYGLGFAGRYSEDHKVLSVMRLYEATFPARHVPHKLRWKRVNQYLPSALRYSRYTSAG